MRRGGRRSIGNPKNRVDSREISRTPCLVFSSDESGDDMILRRTLEGAEKCALRDLRRLLDTEVSTVVPHGEDGRGSMRLSFSRNGENTGLSFFLPNASLAVSIFRPHFPFSVTAIASFLVKSDASGILESD